MAGTYEILLIPGEPETGLWCDECMLPSLIRLPLTVLSEDAVGSGGAVWFCSEHQQ